MAQFVIEADDQATEDVWGAYKEAQFLTRGQVGVVFQACREALAKNAALSARLDEGGDLHSLEVYHAAKVAGLGGGETVLVAAIEKMVAMIQSMQDAMPEGVTLFPGVPRKAA